MIIKLHTNKSVLYVEPISGNRMSIFESIALFTSLAYNLNVNEVRILDVVIKLKKTKNKYVKLQTEELQFEVETEDRLIRVYKDDFYKLIFVNGIEVLRVNKSKSLKNFLDLIEEEEIVNVSKDLPPGYINKIKKIAYIYPGKRFLTIVSKNHQGWIDNAIKIIDSFFLKKVDGGIVRCKQ